MDIRDLNDDQFVDIFGDGAGQTQTVKQQTAFSQGGRPDLNLEIPSTTTEQTTLPPQELLVAQDTNVETDVDLSTEIEQTETEQAKPGKKKKYDFSDMSGYFEDRIKNGKFLPIEEDQEDGSKKVFIPASPEEFDEVIDMQVSYQVEQERQKIKDSWYQQQSPAWQAVAKYAEYTDDPSQIIPFINGVKTIESVSGYDENEIDGAERIVRARLGQRGDDQEVIDEQVEALKTTDKLISAAKKYKPVIIQEEKRILAERIAEEERQVEHMQMVHHSIRENAIKAIEAPIFGKQKLKNDEKMAVYEMIGEPEGKKGFRIYKEIDKLFETGKFDVLTKLALLLANEQSLLEYATNGVKENTAAGLQKKLRFATDSRNTAGRESEEESPSIQRNRTYVAGSGGFSRR